MAGSVPRHWTQFEYRSARGYLIDTLPLRIELSGSPTPARIAALRTNALKPTAEMWRASIFAHGLGSCALGTELEVAPTEEQDFDCITRGVIGDTLHYNPLQIKELVPEDINPHTSLQAELGKLWKYSSSQDLIVAFHLNRRFRLELAELVMPKTTVKEIWVFGAVTPDQSEFILWGDLLSNPMSYQFRYPGL